MIEGKIIANLCIKREANALNKDFDDFVKEIRDHINLFVNEKYELVVDNDVPFGANITVVKKKIQLTPEKIVGYVQQSVSTNTIDIDA